MDTVCDILYSKLTSICIEHQAKLRDADQAIALNDIALSLKLWKTSMFSDGKDARKSDIDEEIRDLLNGSFELAFGTITEVKDILISNQQNWTLQSVLQATELL